MNNFKTLLEKTLKVFEIHIPATDKKAAVKYLDANGCIYNIGNSDKIPSGYILEIQGEDKADVEQFANEMFKKGIRIQRGWK